MLTSISQFQKTIWNQWNIRIVILFSLFLQIFLIVSAPSRKRTRGSFVFFVWLAYLLADWAAGYCIGLISNNQEQKSNLSQNDYLMAFWGPFLLLHLGGPDSISAFAIEDNELWLRHLLALIFQSVTAAYVFLLTLPRNRLWLPTILMFVAGLIKYAERTHALYVAAVNNFRKSLLPKPDAGPNYAKLMEEHSSRREARLPAKIIVIPELRQGSHEGTKDNDDDNEEHVSEPTQHVLSNKEHVELVQKAFFFFHKFQGLIVDMIYSFKDRLDSQQYLEGKTAEEALRLIEIELNFMYEVFYTKASVVRHYRVWFWGKFVSLISIISTIVLFIKEERHGHGFDKLDVKVTYALLSGAVVLDFMALFMRFFSDYTATLSDESLLDSYSASWHQKFQVRLFKYLNESFLAWFLRLREPTWSTIDEGTYKGREKLCTKFLFRRWCGSISGYSLLKYCLDESIPRVVPNNLNGSFNIGKVIQRVCFSFVVCGQDLFYQRDKRSNIKDLLDQWKYQSTSPFLKMLWEHVFDKLKEKSHKALDIEAIQSICSARGERVIKSKLETLLEPNMYFNKAAEQLESLELNVDPNKVAAQLQSLMPYVDPNKVSELLESLKPNEDPNKASAQLQSLKPIVDPDKVAAQLQSVKPYVEPTEVALQFESLKPYVDLNKVSAILESLKPNVDPTEAEWRLIILKSCVDSIKVSELLESLKLNVDPNKVSELLGCLKSDVDPNKVTSQLQSLKPNVDPNKVAPHLQSSLPYVDPNKVSEQLQSLKAIVDPDNVAAQLQSLKPYVDPNEVAVQLDNLKPYVDPNKVSAILESLKPNMDSTEAEWRIRILKSCVDSIKVAAILESSESSVDPSEVAWQLEILKIYVDSIKVAAQFESLKPYVDPNEVVFDESLLLWHIATSLCHAEDAEVEGHKREISMILSDYMLYLLIMQPNMMSAIAGIGQKRFQDTCEEAKKFFKKRISPQWDRKEMLKNACETLMNVPTEEKPIDVKGDRSKSLLFDACRLAKELNKLEDKDEKWEIITCVWVEMLSYAACHCRPTGHLQLLSKGGELISFVWLLMCHLGLSTQFQIKDGDARAKLIVGKLLNQSTKQADNIEP